MLVNDCNGYIGPTMFMSNSVVVLLFDIVSVSYKRIQTFMQSAFRLTVCARQTQLYPLLRSLIDLDNVVYSFDD